MKYDYKAIIEMKNAGLSDDVIIAYLTGKAKAPTAKVGTGSKAPNVEPKPEKPKKEYTIEDVKFDKYNDGCCNWNYYKEVRKAYCYRRQGCKVWRGTVTKPEGFEFDKDQWEADKKEFEAKFPYIKKSDRK